LQKTWTPFSNGVTTFYGTITFDISHSHGEMRWWIQGAALQAHDLRQGARDGMASVKKHA